PYYSALAPHHSYHISFTTPILQAPRLFFHHTPTTEIYTLSLHDALPISHPSAAARSDRKSSQCRPGRRRGAGRPSDGRGVVPQRDRKSTRLNSSHVSISYAVFCLKKKNNKRISNSTPPRSNSFSADLVSH